MQYLTNTFEYLKRQRFWINLVINEDHRTLQELLDRFDKLYGKKERRPVRLSGTKPRAIIPRQNVSA